MIRWYLSFLFLLFISCDANSGKQIKVESPSVKESYSTIYLFRHAEKNVVDPENPRDPKLSEAGEKRAQQLANMLKDAAITQIFSSDYIRTRNTVAPLAKAKKLEVEIYDPRDLESFAATLKTLNGRIAVSGHSNTTPGLVKLLGGEPGNPIEEKSEYDRLYVLVLKNGGIVQSTLLRYGEPYGQ